METMTTYRSRGRENRDARRSRIVPTLALLTGAALLATPARAAAPAGGAGTKVTITEATASKARPEPAAAAPLTGQNAAKSAASSAPLARAEAAVRHTAKAPKLGPEVAPSTPILQTAAFRLRQVAASGAAGKNKKGTAASAGPGKAPGGLVKVAQIGGSARSADRGDAPAGDLKNAPAAADSRIRNFGHGSSNEAAIISSPALKSGACTVKVGESQVLGFRWVSKVAVGNPTVADVVALSVNQVLVNGKTTGETNLFVWDKEGQHEYKVAVVQGIHDMDEIARLVSRDLGRDDIKVRAINDTLFLLGQVKSPAEQQQAEAVAAAYTKNVKNFIQLAQAGAPEGPRPADVAKTLNQVFAGGNVHARALDDGQTVVLEGTPRGDQAEHARKIAQALSKGITLVDYFQAPAAGGRQVLVRSRVVDIDRVKSRELGIDWGPVFLEQGAGGVLRRVVGEQPFQFGEARLGPLKLDQGGPLSRLDPIGFKLRALEQQNAARVLSEPNLLVMEGQKGGILIGGEIPIPVAQQSGTGAGTSITVEYKPFGIRLDVEVVAITDDGVNLRISPEVSALDYTNSVTVNGFNLPALRTRRADTMVHIRHGQTLAIGGLLQNDINQQTKAIPLLSKIPILGELFKNRRFQRGESELVILVTPELPGPDNTVSTPVPNVEIHRPNPDVKAR